MQAIFMKIKYGVHFCPLLHLYYHVLAIKYAHSKLILLILQVLLLKTEEVKSSVWVGWAGNPFHHILPMCKCLCMACIVSALVFLWLPIIILIRDIYLLLTLTWTVISDVYETTQHLSKRQTESRKNASHNILQAL